MPGRFTLTPTRWTPRSTRALARLTVLFTAIALGGACRPRIHREQQIAEPAAADFFEFPERFVGRAVRLAATVARSEIGRPLVFYRNGTTEELVIHDARGLSRQQPLTPSRVTVITFRCLEGRTDRGNLLLSFE